MIHINKVTRKKWFDSYINRGKINRESKITWYKWVSRMKESRRRRRQKHR